MKYLKNISNPIFIILVLSFVPLLWFKGECVIAGGDINQFMSLADFLNDRLCILTDDNMGQYSYAWIGMIPNMGLFWWFFGMFGIMDSIIQRLWFIFSWFISMWGMYILIREVAGSNYSKVGAVIGAFLYIFNVFNGLMALNFTVTITLMVLPYLMLMTIKATKYTREENKYVLLFSLIAIYGAITIINPGYGYIIFLLPISYIVYNMFCPLNILNVIKRLKLVFKILSMSIISISFVMLPYIYTMKEVSKEMTTMVSRGFFGTNSIQEAFRFLAPWAFMSKHYKIPYNPWAHNYHDSLCLSGCSVVYHYLLPSSLKKIDNIIKYSPVF